MNRNPPIALEQTDVPHALVVKSDGAEALEWVTHQQILHRGDQTWPHLVLLDLKLPKVTGLEVLKRLRSDPATMHLPVVIFSSSNEERDLEQSYELGANAYIRKPIVFSEYRATLADLSRFWILRNSVPKSGLQVPGAEL